MIAEMPKPRYPYLRREVTRHGTTIWYFRRPGCQRVRLPNDFGTRVFWEAYEAAACGSALPAADAPETGTLAWLVARYKESAHFAGLRHSTRRMRDNILKSIVKENGHVRFSSITRKHVDDAMQRRMATPHAANNFRKVLSALFKWAVRNEHVAINPCDGAERLKAESDGFHSWTVEEVDKFRTRHPVGTKARLALDLLLFTGLRRSDVVIAGRQHVRAGVLTIRTQKTGETVHVPVFRELQASIDATETGDLAFLTSGTGNPFASAASFGNWFADRCNEAGLPTTCRAHGLRKAGATIAAENGATAHELMAMYGWRRIAQAEIYTREADKVRLARGAAEKIARRTTRTRLGRVG